MRSLLWKTLLCVLPVLAAAAVAADEFARTTIDLGMVVSDLNKSVEFYTKAVGFKEVPGFQAPADVATAAGLTDQQPLDVRVLVLGEGATATKLKLMQVPGVQTRRGDNQFIHSQFGFRYLTIMVTDMNASVARLQQAGVKPVAKCPVELPKSLAPGAWLTVFRDPDGNFVEFVGPKKTP